MTSVADKWYAQVADQSRACSTLPFTIILWVVFVASQLSRRAVEDGFNLLQLNNHLTQDSETLFENVTTCSSGVSETVLESNSGQLLSEVYNLDSPKSVIDWFEEKLLEVFWLPRHRDPLDSSAAYVGHFNRVIGGIRLVQERLKSTDCKGAAKLRSYYGLPCYDTGTKATGNINDLDLEGFRSNSDDEYVFWLDIAKSREEVQRDLDRLRELRWLGPPTSQVEAQFLTYSGEVAILTFARTTFTLDRTGYLKQNVQVTSWRSNTYDSMKSIIWDTLLVLSLIVLLGLEIRRLFKAMQTRKLGDVMNLHMVLNLAIVGLGVCLGAYFSYITFKMQDVGTSVTSVPPPPEDGSSWEARQNNLDEIFNDFATLQFMKNVEQAMVFIYVLLLVLKFFRSFQVVPRLAIVADTFTRSAMDLFHFLLIFGTIFISFTTGAYFMFGPKLVEWSNYSKAMSTSFRALMGDFDFSAMYSVAPVSATIWFWCFMALIFLVMLNMLLAIILDTYNEVKEEGPMMRGIGSIGMDMIAYRLARLRLSSATLDSIRQSGEPEEAKIARITEHGLPAMIAAHILKSLQALEEAEETDEGVADLAMDTPAEVLGKLAAMIEQSPQPPAVRFIDNPPPPDAASKERQRAVQDAPALLPCEVPSAATRQ